MPEPTNPPLVQPPSSRQAAGTDSHDTVLLADVADSNAPPMSAPPAPPSRLDLSSSALEALNQRYEVLSEAGHGSMGNVYKARDRETGEIVALKLLKPEIASDHAMVERFKNELLFARKITHKNVCRVHEFNRLGAIAYTSMEFVQGESLRSVLNRFGGLPVRKALNVALQICSGLKEAHAQGIVHRDLKPENVMVDANGNIKIMDFGIARSMEAATRLTGSMVGTPAYMAPEQVSGKPIDYRTDIYSLGLILYEMFTGSQALQADTPVAVALKQLRETPPPPHEIDPSIPVPIERAILKCLEKEPSKRFQSIAELEKTLSVPGITGTSPGLAPFAAALASAPIQISGPVSLGSPSVRSQHRRISPLIWVLLGASIVVAGFASAHWAKVLNDAKLIPAPPSLPVPKAPELTVTAPPDQPSAAIAENATRPKASATSPLEKKPAARDKQPTPFVAPSQPVSQPKPSNADVFPNVEIPVKKSARQIELEKTPPDVEQRADKAFAESKSADNTQTGKYLWVGRYQREDRAQDVVQKIKGLGLPAKSITRHGLGGDFWVVFCGPFAPKRVSDVTQWLEAQGFRNVHDVSPPGSKPAQNAQTQPK